uniref:Uncharacterized protein n=1 Tax=Labrus bergylta TaxID=56723 RepID=A0A3Q3L8H3_9LABR
MALSFKKDLDKYKDLDEDEILNKLSAEELKQLETALEEMDPEWCLCVYLRLGVEFKFQQNQVKQITQHCDPQEHGPQGNSQQQWKNIKFSISFD